jgi:hypothetical protein
LENALPENDSRPLSPDSTKKYLAGCLQAKVLGGGSVTAAVPGQRWTMRKTNPDARSGGARWSSRLIVLWLSVFSILNHSEKGERREETRSTATSSGKGLGNRFRVKRVPHGFRESGRTGA